MNPFSVALEGKGPFKLARRAVNIAKSYGVTPTKIDHALKRLVAILNRFGCSGTFPITAVVLGRNPQVIEKYEERGVEFAIHGYRHIDHCQLSQAEQLAQLALARQLFADVGIQVHGFRGPYLHANPDTLMALEKQGLIYDGSQAVSWDVLDGCETPAYRHVLEFYGALSAGDFPSLPSLDGDLVRIPYSLPDDEALVHRLSLATTEQMSGLWLAILRRSYELGELFVLGLHPERIFICQEPLEAVLSQAHQLDPPVWIARLNEIAAWWRARTETEIQMTSASDGRFEIVVDGPPGTTVLARAVQVDAPTRPWARGYQQVGAPSFTVQADRRPCVGVTPRSSDRVVSFLRQQGYLVEVAADGRSYAVTIDQVDFAEQNQRTLLNQLEGVRPLVRLGRWPNGACGALAITGDIDAMTLWDYGLRLPGR